MRVLIVEDDELTVRTWRRLLERKAVEVALAESFVAARALVNDPAAPRPDAVLLDLRLPGGSGMDLVPVLRQRWPGIGMALVTAYLDAGVAISGQKAGLVVIPKPLAARDLRRLVGMLASREVTHDAIRAAFPGLSPRELEVVGLAARGFDNNATAAELGCNRRTVETHWTRIFAKTACRGRLELLATLLDVGGGRPDRR